MKIEQSAMSTNVDLSTGGAETVGLAGDAATCLLADSNWFCNRWTYTPPQIYHSRHRSRSKNVHVWNNL